MCFILRVCKTPLLISAKGTATQGAVLEPPQASPCGVSSLPLTPAGVFAFCSNHQLSKILYNISKFLGIYEDSYISEGYLKVTRFIFTQLSIIHEAPAILT
ncbi:hypothetical protein ACFVAD_10085 [Sutcliffiella sp. NPDC057660]|uniref:hypothetical protein n=1 Tax=Sutcliffiella sp. NPDC057660 TaxID=3346199 RepID=UPI003690D896